MQRLLTRFEVKADTADAGAFEGYGATFGNVDLGRDVCDAGCFKASLAEHQAKGTLPLLFWNHDSGEPIGAFSEIREDARGLWVKGRFWVGAGIPKAEQAYRLVQSPGGKGMSIGYLTRKATIDSQTGVRHLVDVDVREISIAPFPVNPEAQVTSVKSRDLLTSLGRLAATLRGK